MNEEHISYCIQCNKKPSQSNDVFCSQKCSEDAVLYDLEVRTLGYKKANKNYEKRSKLETQSS